MAKKTLSSRMARIAGLAYLAGVLCRQEAEADMAEVVRYLIGEIEDDGELGRALYPRLLAVCKELELEIETGSGGEDSDLH